MKFEFRLPLRFSQGFLDPAFKLMAQPLCYRLTFCQQTSKARRHQHQDANPQSSRPRGH